MFRGFIEDVLSNESKFETTVSSHPWKRNFLAHGVGFAAVAMFQGLAALVPDVITTIFSLPAARLASLFLAAPLETGPEGSLILNHHAIEIEVTNSCSGFSFFTLCCALGAGLASIRLVPGQWFRAAPALLLLAYLVTILANTFRMVCAVQIRLFTFRWIPDSYTAAIHMTVGMIVFLPVLFAFWNLLNRYYDRKPN